MDSRTWHTGIRAREKTGEKAEVLRGPQAAATRAFPASEGAPGPPLLRSPPSPPGLLESSRALGVAPGLSRLQLPGGCRAARESEEPKKACAWCARERRGAVALPFLACLEPRI